MSNERELGRTRDVYGHANVRARQSFRFLLFHGYVEQALGRAFAENVQVPRLGFRHNARSLITPLRLRQRVYELVASFIDYVNIFHDFYTIAFYSNLHTS